MATPIVVLCCAYLVALIAVLYILFHVYVGVIGTFKHTISSLDHVDDEVDRLSALAADCIESMTAEIKRRNAEKQLVDSTSN